ncbi:hypothetical protein [Bacillus velezensis]|nr:hypothetical protein [Bacillus velezensis]
MKKLIACVVLTVTVLGLSFSYNSQLSSNSVSQKEIKVAELPVGT